MIENGKTLFIEKCNEQEVKTKLVSSPSANSTLIENGTNVYPGGCARRKT